MEVEPGRVVLRERRARKLAVVVALQNLLVAACLLVTLYIYWDLYLKASPEDTIHIRFVPIADITGNTTLQFGDVQSSYLMSLVGEKNDKIYFNCTGPYILYMDACYKSLHEQAQEAKGILQLQVMGSNTTVSSLILNASHEVCRGLHSIAYLRAKEVASLHLYSTGEFKLKNVTVGLRYLLGRQCEF